MVIIESIAALGGLVAFVGAIMLVIRSVFRLVDSNDDNTVAVKNLTEKIDKMGEKISSVDNRLARVEGRQNGAVH